MAKINRLPLLYLAILLLTVQSPARQEITQDRLAATYVVSHEYGGSSLTLGADGRYSKESAIHDGTEWSESGTYIPAGGVLRFTIERSVQRHRGDVREINLLDPEERKQTLYNHPTAETVRGYELLLVTWSDRIYLIYESDLNNFANAINPGLEPRRASRSEPYYGVFYLRNAHAEMSNNGRDTTRISQNAMRKIEYCSLLRGRVMPGHCNSLSVRDGLPGYPDGGSVESGLAQRKSDC